MRARRPRVAMAVALRGYGRQQDEACWEEHEVVHSPILRQLQQQHDDPVGGGQGDAASLQHDDESQFTHAHPWSPPPPPHSGSMFINKVCGALPG